MFRPWRRNLHLLRPAPPFEIGVDHVALDRPRANDRHFDHEVIKRARAQARQHVHLRSAFDLEHAERIPLAQHVVNRRVLTRDRGQGQVLAVVIAQQVEALAHAGEHAQRQHVDLQDAQRIDIVLIPFDEATIRHRAVADRHRFAQRPLGQNEPADVLRQVPRHPDHLFGQGQHPAQVGITQVQPGFAFDVGFLDRVPVTAPHRLGQRAGHVFGQTHRLAHLADRHARAVMDHRGAQPGAMAAIALIDVLDHFLAPLMLEIDVDIGRLLALFGNEPVEQQGVARRIDRGDFQHIADRRIGRRSAPLAQNRRLLISCKINNIFDG